MGTKFRMCYKCFEYSRDRRGWECPHCNPPRIDLLKISSLGKQPIPVGVRVEYVSYKQWLIDNQCEASPKAWTDYTLRGLRS